MIPKKIHYVWWGKPLSDLEQKWMDNTKRNNPNFQYKIWTNDDVPSCKFLEIALANEQYAYASDYIRLYVLYKEGGIYIDTDMELVKPIPNEWLSHSTILPKETIYEFGGHFIGSVKGNRFIFEMLKKYLDFKGDEIIEENWVIPKILKPTAIKCFGEYSVIEPDSGEVQSSYNLLCTNLYELSPYYPWDKSRINNIDLSNSIGVHYWNNYKKENGLELDSFCSKHFDDE